MNPDEVERLRGRESCGIAGVESLVDVPRHAGDAEFVAYVAAGAAAGHGVQTKPGLK